MISINWLTKVINVPRTDMSLVQASPEIRELDLDDFRLTLKDLEDDEAGMPFLRTHNHNTTVSVGGVTLARVIEIINGYTVTFEDGQYAVNLVGANSNVSDVTNVNQVSVRSSNSAGLTSSSSPGQVATAVWDSVASLYTTPGTIGQLLNTLSEANVVLNTTIVAGSTNRQIKVGESLYEDYYKRQSIQIFDGSRCATRCVEYCNNDTIILNSALPFTPSIGAKVYILSSVHQTHAAVG